MAGIASRDDALTSCILRDWGVVMLVMERDELKAAVKAALAVVILILAAFLVNVSIAHEVIVTYNDRFAMKSPLAR